jgi:hypothetical protein
MNANARAARAARREMTRTRTAARRAARVVTDARRAVASKSPQTARTHLVNAGLTDEDAQRYASAFSRGVITKTSVEQVVRVRRSKATQANHYRIVRRTAKTYDLKTFNARLAVYRPKDDAAAARFETVAQRAA